MKLALLLIGIAAWAAVGGIAWLMADWGEAVIGFFPILGSVAVAWVVGEYVTGVLWKEGR